MNDTVEQQPYAPSAREGVLVTALAAIGFVASVLLTNDKVKALQAEADGDEFTASCDVSAFVSCSGVFNTDQAAVFGIPNPLIGIAGFAVVITLGVLVAARITLPRFVWIGLFAGSVFGIGFVTWLQYQSLYEIGKLCPYCMVVWAVMIPLFVIVARALGHTVAPDAAVTRLLSHWTLLIVLLWYVVILAAIWFQFGETLWA
ncbi:vitamin K epoxide reductase family protein [Aeromicrobium sp. CTD01-1L150]|uniref:vitamin K epoxide reductase family protein n=1 Tax=Aeromicrobium sp. CTD01-1L150 TaxID=3341830 RepID=UPI0035BEF5CC